MVYTLKENLERLNGQCIEQATFITCEDMKSAYWDL